MQNENGTKANFSVTIQSIGYSLTGTFATPVQLLTSKRLRTQGAVALQCVFRGNRTTVSEGIFTLMVDTFFGERLSIGTFGCLYNAQKQNVRSLSLNDGDTFYLMNYSTFNYKDGVSMAVAPGIKLTSIINIRYSNASVGTAAVQIESGTNAIIDDSGLTGPIEASQAVAASYAQLEVIGYSDNINKKRFLLAGQTFNGDFQLLYTSGALALQIKIHGDEGVELNSLSLKFTSMFDTQESVNLPNGLYNADKQQSGYLPTGDGNIFYVFGVNLLNRKNGIIYSPATVVGKKYICPVYLYNGSTPIASTILTISVI